MSTHRPPTNRERDDDINIPRHCRWNTGGLQGPRRKRLSDHDQPTNDSTMSEVGLTSMKCTLRRHDACGQGRQSESWREPRMVAIAQNEIGFTMLCNWHTPAPGVVSFFRRASPPTRGPSTAGPTAGTLSWKPQERLERGQKKNTSTRYYRPCILYSEMSCGGVKGVELTPSQLAWRRARKITYWKGVVENPWSLG